MAKSIRNVFYSIVILTYFFKVETTVCSKPNLAFKTPSDDFKLDLRGNLLNSTDCSYNCSILNNTLKNGFNTTVDAALANKTKFDMTVHLNHDEGIEAQCTMRTLFAW